MSKSSLPKDSDLDLWFKEGLNVLMIGEAGVGKTSMVLDCFNRNKANYFFCSAATMDPWVDFIGIPKERKDESGNVYLDLVRPQQFAEDKIEAIFIDEFNRAPKKIRNAVMELIQFRSINGKKFNNLKVVWAAINPEKSANPEAAYDVEVLDPAQKDRFHIHVNLPYKCSKEYFKKKYNDVGLYLVDWWNSLNDVDKFKISPRRLDYLARAATSGMDIDPFVPENISVSEINKYLLTNKFKTEIKKICESDEQVQIDWISKANNLKRYIEFIKNEMQDTLPIFWRHIPKDYITVLLSDPNSHIRKWVVSDRKIADTSTRELIKEIFSEDQLKNLFSIDFNKVVQEAKVGIDNALNSNYDSPSSKLFAFKNYLSGDPAWPHHEKYGELCSKVENALARTNSINTSDYRNLLAFLYTLKQHKPNITFGSPNNRCRIGINSGTIVWGGRGLADQQVEIELNQLKKKDKVKLK
jgi:hypothetical protein